MSNDAYEWVEGANIWMWDDKLHREDGPAVENPNGSKFYFLYGVELSEELFKKIVQSPDNDLPLYIGMGFDKYIAERLQD